MSKGSNFQDYCRLIVGRVVVVLVMGGRVYCFLSLSLPQTIPITRPTQPTHRSYPRYPSSCNLETVTMERFFNGFFFLIPFSFFFHYEIALLETHVGSGMAMLGLGGWKRERGLGMKNEDLTKPHPYHLFPYPPLPPTPSSTSS